MKLRTLYEKSRKAKDYEEFLKALAEEFKVPEEYNGRESYVEYILEKKLNAM